MSADGLCDPTDMQSPPATLCSLSVKIETKLRSRAPFVDSRMSVQIIALNRLKRCRTLAHLANQLGVRPMFTDHAGHSSEMASALPDDVTMVVAAGGDGTVNEVLNGLMTRPRERRPMLFIFPGGSGNDTARTLGLQRTIADIDRRLNTMATIEWDVFRADVHDLDHKPMTRYGINALSVGISAEVLRIFSRMSPLLPATFRYTFATIIALARNRAEYLDIQVDHGLLTQPAILAAVANCRWFGAGIGIAPQGVPHDGVLNLTVVDNITPSDFVALLPTLRRADVIVDPRIRYEVTKVCELRSKTPRPIEIDGEFSGFTPARVTVIPKAITVVG